MSIIPNKSNYYIIISLFKNNNYLILLLFLIPNLILITSCKHSGKQAEIFKTKIYKSNNKNNENKSNKHQTDKNIKTKKIKLTFDEMLHKAKHYSEMQLYKKAAKMYDNMLSNADQSKITAMLIYNAAVANENAKNFYRASELYGYIINTYPGSKKSFLSSFGLSECYENLRLWNENIVLLESLLEKHEHEMEVWEQIDTLSLLGASYIYTNKIEDGKNLLDQAYKIYKSKERREGYFDAYAIARIYYYRAAIDIVKFTNVFLITPSNEEEEVQAVELLNEKAKWLLKSQKGLLRVVRLGHAIWAAKAGIEIGNLYKNLFLAIVNAPAPVEFDAEHADVYKEALGEKINILIVKAEKAFKVTLDMVKQAGLDSYWINSLLKDIDSLKKLAAPVKIM